MGTMASVLLPKACPQMFFSTSNESGVPSEVLGLLLDTPLFQTVTNSGEDCLTVNVQRPIGTTAADKLPVLFWIFGGGFELGSTEMYDGASMVQESIADGMPIVWVAVNYRVGGFGFMPGKEILADGSSNLGLLDQRLGLQWVQDNIAAFGGDPTKVTIWGEVRIRFLPGIVCPSEAKIWRQPSVVCFTLKGSKRVVTHHRYWDFIRLKLTASSVCRIHLSPRPNGHVRRRHHIQR